MIIIKRTCYYYERRLFNVFDDDTPSESSHWLLFTGSRPPLTLFSLLRGILQQRLSAAVGFLPNLYL